MTIFRYNFNGIQNQDLKKYLHSKLDFERWEESIAQDAIIAHYRYFPKISYGFPMAKNHFVIMKRLLKNFSKEYEMPYIIFDKKNDREVLLKNVDFIDSNDSVYYLRNGEGKREFFNYNLISVNNLSKLIIDKYKDADNNMQFILEKSKKSPLFFQGNSFELRIYILVVQIDKKIYTFLYPLLIAHFGIENINMAEFLNFLDIGYDNNSNINSYHILLDKIYQLVQKTATVIANTCKFSNNIYRIENEKKCKKSTKPNMQYHLFALDIILNEDKNPFLVDIIHNPVYKVSKEESKTIREKNKIFDDILDNFVRSFAKYSVIDYDKSKFILLKESPQYFEYKLIIAKKINDDFIENTEILSKDGEKFLIKCLNDSITELGTNNTTFLNNKKENENENENEKQKEKEKQKEITHQSECIFEEIADKKEVSIDKKIDDLLSKEKTDKIIGIASATLPIFLATYLAKKTYQSFTKKD
jgi:hypothetical protein